MPVTEFPAVPPTQPLGSCHRHWLRGPGPGTHWCSGLCGGGPVPPSTCQGLGSGSVGPSELPGCLPQRPGRGLGRVECARLVCVPADAYRLPLLILASWWARLRFHHWSLREAGRWLVGWPRAGSWGGASCSRSGRPLGSAVRLSDVPRVHPCLDQCSGPVPRAPPPGPPGWGPASPTVCTSRSSTEWSLLHSHCPQGDQVPSFLF